MTGDGAPARSKRAIDAEQRRERIVEVAMQHFAEHGFRARTRRGHRPRGRRRQGHRLPGLRLEGGAVPRGVPARGAVAARLARRAGRDRRAGLLGDPRLVARSHRGVRDLRPGAEPDRADRPLRHRPAGCASRSTGSCAARIPYGTLEFVEFGVTRGEVRDDVDAEMLASMLDWLAERFQDALVSEDLDPGLDPPAARAAGDADQGVRRDPARRDPRARRGVTGPIRGPA